MVGSQNGNVGRDQNMKDFKYHAKNVTVFLWTIENNLRKKHPTLLLLLFSSIDSHDRNLYEYGVHSLLLMCQDNPFFVRNTKSTTL